jgi:putative ABC transport system permease protein
VKTFRELWRSKMRLVVGVAAIALSLAALGVLAVPSVASEALRTAADEDQMAHITVWITEPDDPAALGDLDRIEGVSSSEARISAQMTLPEGDSLEIVGADLDDQRVNVVAPTSGRLPSTADEILVSPAVAESGVAVGDVVRGPAGALTVVGVGDTTAWETESIGLMTPAGATAATEQNWANLVLLRVNDTSSEALATVVDDLRAELAAEGATFASFPDSLADGAHPIEEDIQMISMMIGFLGIVAGIVSLVLLASITSATITDRSREVAVLRALGSGPRRTRRMLRRLALGTAAIGVVVGVPLGIAVSNVVARMVLERFAGITPAVAISWPLVVGSLVFGLLGARLVSARAARRAVSVPLPQALRDRDASSFGSRWYQRLISRVGVTTMAITASVRNLTRRLGRSAALTLQIASGVAAVLIVASLGATIEEFDEAEAAPWQWDRATFALGAGAGFSLADADALTIGEPDALSFGESDAPAFEAALTSDGSIADLEVGIIGIRPDTQMIDTDVRHGRWLSAARGGVPDSSSVGSAEAVIAAGFAEHQGIEVGDTVSVALPSGTHQLDVVGLHPIRSRDVFVDRAAVGAMLERPGEANTVWSAGFVDEAELAAAASEVSASGTFVLLTKADLTEEDRAARQMILGIFTAIGIVVAAVAALGVFSSLGILLHERRRELAALRAAGAPAPMLLRLVLWEMVPVAAVAGAIGAVAAYFGAGAIMGAIESGNSVEIGFAYAWAWVIPTVAVAIAATAALTAFSVSRAGWRAPEAVLRATA